MKLNFAAPLNSLSFGQVSYNVLRELYARGIDVSYHPIGNTDLNAYDVSPEFGDKLKKSVETRYDRLDSPTLKLWHFNDGGEQRVGRGKSVLFTFHETSNPTPTERKIAAVHDKVVVTSSYTKEAFGAENFEFVPLGFDPDFKVLDNPKKLLGRTHWGLMGKFEYRKHTRKIIEAWLKKYGNNPKHYLTCVVVNPFFDQNIMRQQISDALGGKQYHNIQFSNHMPKNAQVNDYLNSIDIDLSGLSGAEGWGLPAFNATALGKYSIVLDATAHKDWATKDNSILIAPSGQAPLDDGFFFRTGAQFNQGNFFLWNEADVLAAFETAEEKIKQGPNLEGLKLQETHTYPKMVDKLTEILA